MRIIGVGNGVKLYRDAYGEMYFSSRETDGKPVFVDPSRFPVLRTRHAEAWALGMHSGLIMAGVSESIAEEFIAKAGFDVTAS